MKKILYILASITLFSCTETGLLSDGAASNDAVQMSDYVFRLGTADNVEVAPLADYVGRKEFSNQDVAVFTTVKRTQNPIPSFTYSDLEFLCSVTQGSSGSTSVGWSRIPEKGHTEAASTGLAPDRIYWSDATSAHTFVGYCAPQQGQGEKAFDWNMRVQNSRDVYFGSLGDPTVSGIIDYESKPNPAPATDSISGNVALCKDDILLTYSEEIVAEDAIAKLRFHHGLAQVRVIVNISDFAAGGGNDTKSVVSNMVLNNMLTMYKWEQRDSTTIQLAEADQTQLNSIYGENAVLWNQSKNTKLWIPKYKGVGQGASRIFTFYGLAVPTTSNGNVAFSFTVTYPNPMDPEQMQDKTYTASISNIKFSAGKCTTISISLNHRNEKMTVGAEYDDWDYIDSPDQGALKKNSTFLPSVDRNSVYILGDEKATADDATWLYVKDGQVVDIYGNDGTAQKPYTISTAAQLLSFAYEVAGNNRHNVTPTTGATLKNGAWDFEGKYIKLDADIHLQSVVTVDSLTKNKQYVDKVGVQFVNWPGVGTSTNPFNGYFLGSSRYITHLYGGAFFNKVGDKGVVLDLNFSNTVRVNSHGALAESNEGFLCACRVEGEVQSDNDYVGSLCGENSGFIFACIHNGAVKGTKNGAKVGGLLGRNNANGKIAVSYHTGAITGTTGISVTKYGVVDAADSGSKIYNCYYNKTLATPTATVDPANIAGKTIGEMQSRGFVTELNTAISGISADSELFGGISETQKAQLLDLLNSYEYKFTPGAYPRVGLK